MSRMMPVWGLSLAAMLAQAIAQPVVAAVSCSVSAIGPAFGVYSPLSATPNYANGSITATCTLLSGGATSVSMVSNYSAGASGTYATRTLLSGTQQLDYNLYFDAAYTQIRGNGTGGSQQGGANFTLTPSAPTGQTTSIIYGRIPAAQDVGAGAYMDTIVVTITY
jgi:spore coat protein U-like protein